MIDHSYRNAASGAVLALGLLSSGTVSAQLTTSSLEGSASAGDSVTVRNVVTNHTLEAVVASNGRFHFRRLPLGIYEVVIRRADGGMEPMILARARLGETVRVN